MPYYGDHFAGDPGLFSFLKKIKLRRIIGGIVKSAIPGAAGVLSAVRAIRGTVESSPAVPGKPGKELTVAVPTTVPTAAPVKVSRTRATRAAARGAQFTRTGKAESAFARRMRLARAARRRGFAR